MKTTSHTTMRPATQKRPKRAHPFFILLVTASILAFLLFLHCDGYHCLATTNPIRIHALFSTHHSIRETLTESQILALKEGVGDSDLVSHQRSEPLQESRNGSSVESANFIAKPRMPKRNKALLFRVIPSDAKTRRFSASVERFFHGCRSRFFMTWISSLESFGKREMLAMESLFRFHPDACLLVLSHTMDSAAGGRLLRPLADRGHRVTAISPSYTFLFKNTPAERWFARLLGGDVKPGNISLGQNLSNLLRLAVLYKFGGTYVDTDVIFIKSIHNLRNVIGAQSVDDATGEWSRLNNAVLVFDKKHPLLHKFMEEFALTFDGSKWGHNGPYLVSRVVRRVAGRPGYEFTVLPQGAFYPVGWSRIDELFHGPRGAAHSNWIAAKLRGIRERSFAVHLWNRQSRGKSVEEGSVMAQIIADACVFCGSSSSSNH